MATRSSNKSGGILDAANRIVEMRGTAHLTIDAVAAEAGMSKGGVLYHYGSKKLLLEALRDRAIQDLEQRFAALSAAAPDNRLLAWLEASNHAPANLGAAVFASAAEAPEMLDPPREFMAKVLEQLVADAGDPDLARILFVAALGLRLNEMFNLITLTPAQRAGVDTRLAELAREAQT